MPAFAIRLRCSFARPGGNPYADIDDVPFIVALCRVVGG